MSVIIFVTPKYLNLKMIVKNLNYLSFIAYTAIGIQYFAYYLFYKYIEFKIPFLKYSNTDMDAIQFQVIRLNEFRPSSIFIEPAHFVYFGIIYIVVTMFWGEYIKYKNIKLFIATISLLLSTSSTAVILLVFAWGAYGFNLLYSWQQKGNLGKFLILIILVAFIFLPYYVNNSHLSQSFERITDFDGPAVQGRIFAGEYLLETNTGFIKWIGRGFGNLESYVYMNGVNYLNYTLGVLGIAILLIVFLIVFKRSELLGKILLLIMIMLNFSSPFILTVNITLYGSIISLSQKNNKSTLI